MSTTTHNSTLNQSQFLEEVLRVDGFKCCSSALLAAWGVCSKLLAGAYIEMLFISQNTITLL